MAAEKNQLESAPSATRQRRNQNARHEANTQRPGRRAIRLGLDPVLQLRELAARPGARLTRCLANRVRRGVPRRAKMLFHLLRACRCARTTRIAIRARTAV